MIPPKNHLIAPFKRLSALWQTDIDWAAFEKLDRLEYINETFDTDLARRLNLDTLRDLQEMFGEAIQFTLSIGDLEVLRLQPANTTEDLAEFQKNITGSPNVKLSLRINKQLLANIYFAEILGRIPEEKEYYLYLFPKQCEQFLTNCKLEDLETYLWKKKAAAKVVILLPDVDIYLVGAQLLILGGSYLSPETVINGFETEKNYSIIAFKVCRENLIWQEAWLSFLTPWHLFVKGETEKDCKLNEILSLHFGNAALLYAADQTLIHTAESQNRISRFKSPDKQIEIPHALKGAHFDLTPDQLDQVKKILEWIYDPQWKSISDRLTLAQQNIVDQLNHEENDKRFAALFQKAEGIQKNIVWHWETFTKKKIDAYFGVVKDYENYLSQVAQGFASDIAAIQKTLSDTLLAAVAVLIGSFIASLFKDPFNPYIFRAGMTIYAIYILAIPLLYNMILQWKKYRGYQEQRDVQKKRLGESLPDPKIKEIWNAWKMDAISKRFERVFWVTIGIYSLVIILMLAAAWLVPPEVLAGAMKSVNPTITPSVTPTIFPTITPVP